MLLVLATGLANARLHALSYAANPAKILRRSRYWNLWGAAAILLPLADVYFMVFKSTA